jgi:hypothetical protein
MPVDTRGSLRWVLVSVVVLIASRASGDEVLELELEAPPELELDESAERELNQSPELELLEFLFEWQDEDGTMLDPRMFDDDPQARSQKDVGGPDAFW